MGSIPVRVTKKKNLLLSQEVFFLLYGNRKAVKKTCRWHVFRPWEIPFVSGCGWYNHRRTQIFSGGNTTIPDSLRVTCRFSFCRFLRNRRDRPKQREGNKQSGGLFVRSGEIPLIPRCSRHGCKSELIITLTLPQFKFQFILQFRTAPKAFPSRGRWPSVSEVG